MVNRHYLEGIDQAGCMSHNLSPTARVPVISAYLPCSHRKLLCSVRKIPCYRRFAPGDGFADDCFHRQL